MMVAWLKWSEIRFVFEGRARRVSRGLNIVVREREKLRITCFWLEKLEEEYFVVVFCLFFIEDERSIKNRFLERCENLVLGQLFCSLYCELYF